MYLIPRLDGAWNIWTHMCSARVPQVVLPMQMDCYELAVRGGISGRRYYANKSTTPEANAKGEGTYEDVGRWKEGDGDA